MVIAVGDRVVPAAFFTHERYSKLSPEAKVILLLLTALADKDGIAPANREILDQHVPQYSVMSAVKELKSGGHLATYKGSDGNFWAWVPWVSEHQPTRGNMRLQRDAARAAPEEQIVFNVLHKRLGMHPTKKQMRAASPRTFGLKRASIVAEPYVVAGEGGARDGDKVWNTWRGYQSSPERCHLGPAVRSMIERALKEASAEDLCDLIKYAYEADEEGPRFWRGENGRRRTYLGLDNLLRANKISGRIQMMQEWVTKQNKAKQTNAHQDGTDLGPLAAYRRTGPSGTISTPTPRPKRLSDQCVQILKLFKERGDSGVRTNELAQIALKYTGRISEIRGAGHDIYLAEREPTGNNLYVLRDLEAASGLDR